MQYHTSEVCSVRVARYSIYNVSKSSKCFDHLNIAEKIRLLPQALRPLPAVASAVLAFSLVGLGIGTGRVALELMAE